MAADIPPQQTLAEALAAFQSTRPTYPSSSDQALTQIILALVDEVRTLRRDVQDTPAPDAQPLIPAESMSVMLVALQQEVQELRATCQAQQQELDALRTLLAQRQSQRRSSILAAPTPVSQPRVLRPMDYWVNHVPDYGDTLTQTELAAHLDKPRVRPEDVTLTPDDLARQRRRPPASPRWDWQASMPIGVIILAAIAMAILGFNLLALILNR